MSIPPPELDQRNYQDLVLQTQQLAEAYTDWRSPHLKASKSDAGVALIRIFAHFANLIRERLNHVPDRNLLAFINLIGTQLTPAQPARVPVSFHLATGSPVDALVPAQTQVSAPPKEGNKEEVIFETERDLLVSNIQLQSMYVVEDRDYYSDRCAHITPTTSPETAFLAFKGECPVDHFLYVQCEEIFNLQDLTTVRLFIETESEHSAAQLKTLLKDWFYWDESQKNWQPLAQVQVQEDQMQVRVTLAALPVVHPVEVNGIQARWLRVSLKPHRRQALPEVTQIQVSTTFEQTHPAKTGLFNTIALDLSKDFYPFGTAPNHNDTFAIELDSKFLKPGVVIRLEATLNRAPEHTDDLELVWETGDGQQWQAIAPPTAPHQIHWQADTAAPNFSTTPTVSTLQFPPSSGDSSLPTTANWVRARILQGLYGSRGRERKYAVYNDATLLAQAAPVGQQTIVGDGVDELQVGDTIRIQAVIGQPRQEEAKITRITLAEKRLHLDHPLRNAYEAGSRILNKFTIAENTPDHYDPPLIQSLSLTYQFTLTCPAIYCAYNDFMYGDARPFQVRLLQTAHSGDLVVYLEDVSSLAIGELVRFEDGTLEQRQIELIDGDRSSVIVTAPLEHEHLRGTRMARAFHPLTPQLNRHSALYLGFNQPFPNRLNTLYVEVAPPHPEEVAPGMAPSASGMNLKRIAWEYASPQGWQPLVVHDETQALAEAGLIQFVGPTDFIPAPYFGQRRYWLRARKKANDWERIPFALVYFFNWAIHCRQFNLLGLMRYLLLQVARSLDFPVPPRVRTVRTNTTWATQTLTLKDEVLGASNGELNQQFFATQTPILLGQTLEVQEGQLPSPQDQQILLQTYGAEAMTVIEDDTGRLEAVWVRWQEVPDFYSSTPQDRHYTLDHQSGLIQFGNGQAGMIPPRGRNNIRLKRYQTGGGLRGNRPAQTIAELKTTIPYIDRVMNWEAATGGTDQESLERLKQRSPQRLRNHDRTVTAQDFEDLAYEASIEVARVKVITPELLVPDFNPLLEELWREPESTSSPAVAGNEIQLLHQTIQAGQVEVIIVPHSPDAQPTPNLALINRVEAFLQARLVPTLKLQVTGPRWQEIRVIAEIVPASLIGVDQLRVTAEQNIQHFLHPLTGGNEGKGWSFGRKPHLSDLYAVLESIPGISYVRSLEIHPHAPLIDQRTLIYPGQSLITIKRPGEAE